MKLKCKNNYRVIQYSNFLGPENFLGQGVEGPEGSPLLFIYINWSIYIHIHNSDDVQPPPPPPPTPTVNSGLLAHIICAVAQKGWKHCLKSQTNIKATLKLQAALVGLSLLTPPPVYLVCSQHVDHIVCLVNKLPCRNITIFNVTINHVRKKDISHLVHLHHFHQPLNQVQSLVREMWS